MHRILVAGRRDNSWPERHYQLLFFSVLHDFPGIIQRVLSSLWRGWRANAGDSAGFAARISTQALLYMQPTVGILPTRLLRTSIRGSSFFGLEKRAMSVWVIHHLWSSISFSLDLIIFEKVRSFIIDSQYVWGGYGALSDHRLGCYLTFLQKVGYWRDGIGRIISAMLWVTSRYLHATICRA